MFLSISRRVPGARNVAGVRRSVEAWRTFWAVADQAAASGGNFLTNLILLRALLPSDFGTYALVLNAIVFCNTLQQAFISYPLCVRGARAQPRQFRRILGFALTATTLLLATLLAPAVTIVGISLHLPAVALAAAFGVCCWQLQDTLRSGFIAQRWQNKAFPGDAVSYLGQALILGCICRWGAPPLAAIFWIIAATSLAAALIQGWQSRPSVPPLRTVGPLIREFWFLGRWNVVATLVGFFTLQAFPWLLLFRHGPAEVAAFQALFQFLAFGNPLLFRLGSLITATVARHGDDRVRSVRAYLLFTSGVMGCYLLLLAGLGSDVMRLLYGGQSPYLVLAPLMPLYAAAWAFEVVALLATAVLGGLRRPRSLFALQSGGAAAAVLVALPMTYWNGLVAAGMGMLLVNLVRAAIGVVFILRHRGNQGSGR